MPRKKAASIEPTNRWRNRIVREGTEAPDQLLANPRNFRIHTNDQRKALAGALTTLGWIQRVIVNQRTGHMIDGHLRVSEAISRGEGSVPVTYVDLSEDEERLALATLDPIAAMAATDDEKLREVLEGLEVPDQDLAAFLDELLPEEEKSTGGASTKADPTTVPGELIELGAHRVLCGDPEDEFDRAAVMSKNEATPILDLVQLTLRSLLGPTDGTPTCIIIPEPEDCDTLVSGWERATGRKAKRIPPGG